MQHKCYTLLYWWLGNTSFLSTTGKVVARAQRVKVAQGLYIHPVYHSRGVYCVLPILWSTAKILASANQFPRSGHHEWIHSAGGYWPAMQWNPQGKNTKILKWNLLFQFTPRHNCEAQRSCANMVSLLEQVSVTRTPRQWRPNKSTGRRRLTDSNLCVIMLLANTNLQSWIQQLRLEKRCQTSSSCKKMY